MLVTVESISQGALILGLEFPRLALKRCCLNRGPDRPHKQNDPEF